MQFDGQEALELEALSTDRFAASGGGAQLEVRTGEFLQGGAEFGCVRE